MVRTFLHESSISLPVGPDMSKRAEDWERPHVTAAFSNYFDTLEDPSIIQFVLSCQLQQSAWSAPFR